MTMRPGLWAVLAALCWAGCGLGGNGTGPGEFELRTEVVLEPEAGLEGAVRVDSVAWRPTLIAPGLDVAPGELEGTFAARFTSLANVGLEIRYDLRFYDPDGFLIDAFIPFGQPVQLAPGQVRGVEGNFFIRADDPRDLERVSAMHLVARVMKAGS
jgi:hypothetical protein